MIFVPLMQRILPKILFNFRLTKTHISYIISAVNQIWFTAFNIFGGVRLLKSGIEMAILLDTYEKLLTDTQVTILRMRYDEDLSLGEIGEILDISRQAVRNAIIKGEEKLKFYEQTLKLAKKDRAILSLIDDLESKGLNKEAQTLKNVMEES